MRFTPQLLSHYLAHAGLTTAHPTIDEDFIRRAEGCLHAKPDTQIDWEKLFTYPVPKLSPDGSCSVLDTLEEKPYDLRDTILHTCMDRDEKITAAGLALFRLNLLVELLHRETQSDWTGIYLNVSPLAGGNRKGVEQPSILIKLAYRGRPSRAEFPLTIEFARHSNNSTVGLTGKAVLVESVQTHLDAGKPYYECDAAVQSELCLPIFHHDLLFLEKEETEKRSPFLHSETLPAEYQADTSNIMGIFDLESFAEYHFTNDRILKAAIVCFSASILLQRLKSII